MYAENYKEISIHLMFLLISFTRAALGKDVNFNTSHVSINPAALGKLKVESDFNTSHVSINPFLQQGCRFHPTISIHLMFLLIGMRSIARSGERISIHLMFLLIRPDGGVVMAFFTFQYISCFY